MENTQFKLQQCHIENISFHNRSEIHKIKEDTSFLNIVYSATKNKVTVITNISSCQVIGINNLLIGLL